MNRILMLLIVGVSLTACQSAKKEEMAAAEPVAVDAKAGDPAAPAADTKAAMTKETAAPVMADKNTKFPVKTKDSMSFGDQRSIPNKCAVPPEGKQKGAPLSEAIIAGWPQQFFSDVAIMKAALAGVAYPEEVAYIQDCMGAKVLEQQVPGQMPAAK